MILYKSIALKFGHNIENQQPADMHGHDGRIVLAQEVFQHWQRVFKEISDARLFLLDHNAANYLDSLRMDVQGMPWEVRSETEIQRYLKEVELPPELIWVEYDDRKLWEGRIERGLTSQSKHELESRQQRGFLFDNRSNNKLTVRLFNTIDGTSFLDAPMVLELSKSEDGRPDFTKARWKFARTVVAGLLRANLIGNETDSNAFFAEHKDHLSYEMVIVFMLFAALASRDDDLRSRKVTSLSNSQIKTARKFGKTWMTEALKSHLTINIGPIGERHLEEQKARLKFERTRAPGRATPSEHWVAEHERHYADGKIVRVRAHKRGRPVENDLPIRVVGPKGQS